MTKPKTTAQLLAEANKLAMERGMGMVIQRDGYFHDAYVSTRVIEVSRGKYAAAVKVSAESKTVAIRCLIAALREVPVKKGKKR